MSQRQKGTPVAYSPGGLHIIIVMSVVFALASAGVSSAYWVWTPESKKFINPKYAVKDTPKEQFDWAMSFFNTRDYKRSAAEFEKLVKHYEYSEYASKAQYYVGLCNADMGKHYIAFQNYQKAIDNFPHIENIEEIIDREFAIGDLYFEQDNPKVLGVDIITSLDRAIEIYGKVAENAPYGPRADEALFKLGMALEKSERYEEAINKFQKLANDHPKSKFADRARYEAADCAYKSSLKPAYALEPTDNAIKAFEDFVQANRDEDLSREAEKTLQRLKDRSAEKLLLTAAFYEKQKHYPSAIVYYRQIIAEYPNSSYVDEARAKISELEKKAARR